MKSIFVSSVLTLILSSPHSAANILTPESVLNRTESHEIAFVGKLSSQKILTVTADGKVLQVGGDKVIQKTEYPERGIVLYTTEVTPKEIVYDPKGYFKKNKTITVFWYKGVHIQKGSNSISMSMCPAIQHETFNGKDSIILLNRKQLGYVIDHSLSLNHLKDIKAERIKRSLETKRLMQIATLQKWSSDIWFIDEDPFEQSTQDQLKALKSEQEKAYEEVAKTTAASFLFTASYPLRNYGPLIMSRDKLDATKSYFTTLESLRDEYQKNPYHNEEVLILINEILLPASSFKPAIHYNTKFVKLAKLINAPDYLFFPTPKK